MLYGIIVDTPHFFPYTVYNFITVQRSRKKRKFNILMTTWDYITHMYVLNYRLVSCQSKQFSDDITS